MKTYQNLVLVLVIGVNAEFIFSCIFQILRDIYDFLFMYIFIQKPLDLSGKRFIVLYICARVNDSVIHLKVGM